MALKGIFQYKPEVVLSRVDRIFEKMEDMGSSDKMYLYMLLDDVGKKNAEVRQWHFQYFIASPLGLKKQDIILPFATDPKIL